MQHIYIQSIEISDSRAVEHCPELIVGAGTATTADVTDWTITCVFVLHLFVSVFVCRLLYLLLRRTPGPLAALRLVAVMT